MRRLGRSRLAKNLGLFNAPESEKVLVWGFILASAIQGASSFIRCFDLPLSLALRDGFAALQNDPPSLVDKMASLVATMVSAPAYILGDA